jgi:60 kDa SS-A/Ro ribonucleoprotein
MTSIGFIAPMSRAAKLVHERLENVDEIRKARLHPLQILIALRTYQKGHGDKGSLAWQPERRVSDALDAAFYLAFKAVEPTGKRYLLGIDVSGSMSDDLSGLPISAREGACAMAMITAATEAEHHFFGFSDKFVPLLISPRQRLDDVCEYTRRLPSGGTDCALPMLYATQRKIPVDVFCIYTDSETWFGNVHPTQALQAYRQKTGIPAKLVVCGMISNRFTIADPKDAGQMDVVGFDTTTPSVISDFAR